MGVLFPSGNPEDWTIGGSGDKIGEFMINVIGLALVLAGAVAVIYLIYGAFQYFTAFGSEEKATKAKSTILWAIVGIIVILLSRVIISWVWNFVSAIPVNLPVTIP